jgi:formylmethanofuran dehydrogenase subunit A
LALEYRGSNLAFSGAGQVQGPATVYPQMFSWLWDPGTRRQDWGDEPGSRQYSLEEWVWATRTLPARLLGLTDRGHLGVGARADVAIYDLPPEAPVSQWSQHLSRCRTLLKAGEAVIDDFILVKPDVARSVYYRRTEAEAGELLAELYQYHSFRPENLWVRDLGGPWVGV